MDLSQIIPKPALPGARNGLTAAPPGLMIATAYAHHMSTNSRDAHRSAADGSKYLVVRHRIDAIPEVLISPLKNVPGPERSYDSRQIVKG